MMIFVLSEHGVILIFMVFGQVIVLYRQFEIAFDVVFVSDGVYSLEHLFLYIVDKGLNMNLVRVLSCVVAFNC